LIIVWARLWPQSGDGDAVTHYLIARNGPGELSLLMSSWARIGAMLPLLLPAQFGIMAARCTSALISVICAWQTIRLADDLELRNAFVAAPLLLLQPLVFALAADTMTELPMALGLVIAIRLWWARRWLGSALVVSWLPLVRPEGFFVCAMWALMILLTPRTGSWSRRLGLAISLASGVAAWAGACWIICGKPDYFFHDGWSWPLDSVRVYVNGSFFSYLDRWPTYCGLMLPLFLLGMSRLGHVRWLGGCGIAISVLQFLLPPRVRETILPWPMLAIIAALAWSVRRDKLAIGWWAFLLIFTLHTILWWRGWFASSGLLRIMVCVSPITAVICLRGWNTAAAWLRRLGVDQQIRRWIAAAAIGAMALTAMGYYVEDPIHYRVFGTRAVCDYARDHRLLDAAPLLIPRDTIALVELNLPPNPSNVLPLVENRAVECQMLLAAPIGSIGFWDDQHQFEPNNVNLRDLPTLGFTVLFQTRRTIYRPAAWLLGRPRALPQVHVLIRKDRRGALPADVAVSNPLK